MSKVASDACCVFSDHGTRSIMVLQIAERTSSGPDQGQPGAGLPVEVDEHVGKKPEVDLIVR